METNENTTPPTGPARCGSEACDNVIAPGARPFVLALPDGKQVQVCELCFLRLKVSVHADQVRRLTGLLGGVLMKLGGVARIHRLDIARALAAGGFDSAEQPGGFIDLRLKEPTIVVAPAGAVPPGGG